MLAGAVALGNKIRESDFLFFFFEVFCGWGLGNFLYKMVIKNETEKEYVSKLEFQKCNHCLVCPISSPEPLDFM